MVSNLLPGHCLLPLRLVLFVCSKIKIKKKISVKFFKLLINNYSLINIIKENYSNLHNMTGHVKNNCLVEDRALFSFLHGRLFLVNLFSLL